MLNGLWAAMILVGIFYGAVRGRMPEITEGALTGAKDAVNLCLTMAGVSALWTGLMEIAEGSGLLDKAARGLKPLIRFLFPQVPDGHPAQADISANMIANFLGLGWAATPAGIRAMSSLETLNNKPGVATDAMCMFLIVNISSLQLIPVNMIAYRSQYGSANPAAVIMPALIATTTTTICGILFAKFMGRKSASPMKAAEIKAADRVIAPRALSDRRNRSGERNIAEKIRTEKIEISGKKESAQRDASGKSGRGA